MQCDCLQIEPTVKIDRCNDVSSELALTSVARQGNRECTHWSVGTIPLTPWTAPGVAAGVAGLTSLAAALMLPPDCCPFVFAFAPEAPLRCCPSFSDEGGVKSPAPPGNDSDEGAVKARACSALAG